MDNNNIILSQIPLEQLKEIMRDCIRQELDKSNSSSKDPPDELIKASQAIKLLGISKVTLSVWKAKGLIPFYRISSRVYFKKSEILEALKMSPRYKRK